MNTFSEVQELHFRLMELASFNNFDGPSVVQDLRKNSEYWQAAVMLRNDEKYFPLSWLQDVPDGYWNVDTLYVIPRIGQEDVMLPLIWDWRPDEIVEVPIPPYWGSDGLPCSILRIWWD